MPSRRSSPNRVRIGYLEMVDLPDWGISRVRAKVDTGARSSALHVDGLQELASGRVRFQVVLHRKKLNRRVWVEAPIARTSRVRSSNGSIEMRHFVTTRMQLGHVEREIEISLASRHPMRHRMLLGRSALEDLFLIDAGRRYVATGHLTTKSSKKEPSRKPHRRD